MLSGGVLRVLGSNINPQPSKSLGMETPTVHRDFKMGYITQRLLGIKVFYA